MSSSHPDIGPELRQLAQALLDRLDPAMRGVAAMAADGLRGPGSCQQVWCPVCALAALVRGEEHPMLTVIAEHSVALLEVIRAMAADPQAEPPPADAAGDDSESPERQHGRYQDIPIVVED